jgi:YD repeat-containing protein
VTTSSFLGSGNRWLLDETHLYEYDAQGNVTRRVKVASGESWDYSWDHRGRLLEARYDAGPGDSVKDTRVEYVYDGLDRLVARRETKDPLGAATATTTGFVYDGSRRLLELDLDVSQVVNDYLDSPTGELAAVGSTWLLSDETGTARTLAKYTPGGYWLASHRDFDAFGDSREWRGTPVDSDLTSTPDNLVRGNDAAVFATFPRVYLGGYFDAAAGLYQLGGSWYDPLTGRFAQDTGGENGYALSGDAPYRPTQGTVLDEETGRWLRDLVGDERLAGASDAAVIGGTVAAAVPLGIGIFYGGGALIRLGAQAWSLSVPAYVGVQTGLGVAQTTAELGIGSALGSDPTVSGAGLSLARNVGGNLLTGGIAGSFGAFWARQGVQASLDTAIDVGVLGYDPLTALAVNAGGNVLGEGLARGLVGGARRLPALRRTVAATPELVEEIVSVGPPRSKLTVAVIETRQGKTIVAGGAEDLIDPQKSLARKRGLLVADDMKGFHAEITALSEAGRRGLVPTRGVTSIRMCIDGDNSCLSQLTRLAQEGGFVLEVSPDRRSFAFHPVGIRE